MNLPLLLAFFLIASIILLILFVHLKAEYKKLKSNHDILQKEKSVVMDFFEEIGTTFTQSLKIDELLKMILICSTRTTKAKGEVIFLIDEEIHVLKAQLIEGVVPPLKAQSGLAQSKLISKTKYLNENLLKTTFQLGEGIVGEVALNKKSILIEDTEHDPRIPSSEIDYLKVQTLMATPLIFQNKVLGVMIAVNKENDIAFTETDLHLFEALAGQAATSIYNTHVYKALAEKERYDQELQIAKEIQGLLLPKTYPHLEEFEISAFSQPAFKVGGDYYDFITLPKNQLGIAIADVSGKGIPASLIMVMARSMLRSLCKNESSASNVLRQLNALLFPDFRKDMFISITYLVIDTHLKSVQWARAGHEPLLIYRAKENKVECHRSSGMVIGLDSGEIFNPKLEVKEVILNPNDFIILYTDGVTEAINKSGEEFGLERLQDAIRLQNTRCSAQDIVDNIYQHVQRFVGATAQNDDLTLVAIKNKAPSIE